MVVFCARRRPEGVEDMMRVRERRRGKEKVKEAEGEDIFKGERIYLKGRGYI